MSEIILMGISIRISAERLRRGHAVYTPFHLQDFASRISLLFTIPMLSRRRSAKAIPKATPSYTSPRLTSDSVSGRQSSNLATHQQPFRASTAQTVQVESFVSGTSPSEILPVPLLSAPFPPSPPGNSGPRRQQTLHDTLGTLYSPPLEEHVPPQPPNLMHTPTSSVSQTQEPPTPPPYKTTTTSEDVHAGVWSTYNKVSREMDEKRLKKWNDDLDVLLIFVSFVVEGDR
jgi:hypothetical protein